MNTQIQIKEVTTAADVQSFIKLPYKIYANDPFWVPPLEKEIAGLMKPESNSLLRKGEHTFLLALRNGEVVARLGVGIDEQINQEKERKEGWFTLFESVSDFTVAQTILDAASEWLRARGMDTIVGPISPTKGDDYRGLMIMGYASSPVVMNTYNPKYYLDLFAEYGFTKNMDFCAYYYDLQREIDPKLIRGVEMAKKRYGYEVTSLRLEKIDEEIRDVKAILDDAIPKEWPHLVPPSAEELQALAKVFTKFAEPGLINIARHGDRPIGFAIALPDYNQVLKHLHGRITPLGALKFLWYKRKIRGGRIFVNFVVPDFHRKGVSAAIYLKTFQAARELGYTFGEGSYIGEWNAPMRRDAEGAGGLLYKMYRIYEKIL